MYTLEIKGNLQQYIHYASLSTSPVHNVTLVGARPTALYSSTILFERTPLYINTSNDSDMHMNSHMNYLTKSSLYVQTVVLMSICLITPPPPPFFFFV